MFVGFAFVSQEPCEEIGNYAHGMSSVPSPRLFQTGVCYTYLIPNRSGPPTYEVLERRLRSSGAELLHAPSVARDFVQPFLGGPLFHIDFRRGSEQGVIGTVQEPAIASDPVLRQQWKTEVLVLRLR